MFRNKLIMILVFALALGAIAGMANAAPIPVSCVITSINQNGNYIGVPTILGDVPGHIGYNYAFNPDGTYTIYGTLTNYDPYHDYTVFVAYDLSAGSGWIVVPADSKVDFSFTASADSYDTVMGDLWWEIDGFQYVGPLNLRNVELTQTPYSSHTFDEGPMSGQVAIYKDGKITYSGAPLFIVDFVY